MDAIITGESERVGLSVIDNNGVEHLIEMNERGEIKYHEQDGYPDDADERTSEGNEHVNQARRYAKYYVFAERGYDTLEHAENPAYVEAARRAIKGLSPTAFERYFGGLYRQLRSHHDDTERPRELPSGVRKPDAVVYEPELYLALEVPETDITERVRALAEAYDIDDETTIQPATELDVGAVETWQAFGEDLASVVEAQDIDTEVTITGISGLHVGYPNRRGRHEVDEADSPFPYPGEVRLSLLPSAPESFEQFPEYLDHHLRCQARDCFLKMGVVPPEPYRVVGFGKFRDARRYDHYDCYPPVHRADSEDTPLL